ncbi:hypothetical protein Q5P01_003005 [Channa striata]|uniref:Ig-like domain-containing protein n=1 Tax=Channa striata TaxID=64152 RepID=A0AA88NRH6_CHASR|nr:hypothetical protein Q5P01_003005 [Channa striata]
MSASKWTVFVCLLKYFLKCSAFEEKTAKPGDNIPFQCEGPTDADIDSVMLRWSRPGLKSEEYVFYFRDKRVHEDFQHESFHRRVELMDPKMKNGKFSVIVKNVTINDSGTYECYVGIKGNKPQLLNTTKLTVTDSGQTAGHIGDGGDKDGGDKDGGDKDGGDKDGGDKDGGDKDGGDKDGHVGLVVGLSVVGVLLLAAGITGGFVMYKKHKGRSTY